MLGNEAECRIYAGWVTLAVLFFGGLESKFIKYRNKYRGPFVASKPFPDCLYRVSFRRYSSLVLHDKFRSRLKTSNTGEFSAPDF